MKTRILKQDQSESSMREIDYKGIANYCLHNNLCLVNERNEWVKLAHSLMSEGVDFDLFLAMSINWSRGGKRETEQSCREFWNRELRKPHIADIRAFVNICKAAGIPKSLIYAESTAIDSEEAKQLREQRKEQLRLQQEQLQAQERANEQRKFNELCNLLNSADVRSYINTEFYRWLKRLTLGNEYCYQVEKVLHQYGVKSTGKWVLFPAFDVDGVLRWGKQMTFKITEERQCKRDEIRTNCKVTCFFGEHLLKNNTSASINIVESEKTAIVGAVRDSSAIWLATGGSHNLYNLADRLKGYTNVSVWADNDNEGEKWLKFAITKGWTPITLSRTFTTEKDDAADVIVQDWKNYQDRNAEQTCTLYAMCKEHPNLYHFMTKHNLTLKAK